MAIDLNLNIKLDPVLTGLLRQAVGMLATIGEKETRIMATLQDIVNDVAAESTAIDSLGMFVRGLQDQIKALPGISAEMQTQIDGIFTAVEKNKSALAAAMAPAVVTPAPVVV